MFSIKKTKLFILLFLVLSLIVSINQQVIAENNSVKLKKAYENYIDYPTNENKQKLVNILSQCESNSQAESLQEVIDYILNNFSVVEKEIKKGDLGTIDILFKLRRLTDAANSEYIDIHIGSVISSHPKSFLLVLNKNLNRMKRLGSILGNLGPDYVDEINKSIEELESRYIAIKEVENESLKKVKNICLYILSNQISSRRKDLVCFFNDNKKLLEKIYH